MGGPVASPDSGRPGPNAPRWLTAAPIAFFIVLLLLATAFHGAFELRHWGPPALFALMLLVAVVLNSGVAPVRGTWLAVVLAGIWGFAAWTLLSMLWSPSPGAAWEAGARAVLYAALVTIPVATVHRASTLRAAGHAMVAGIALLALITLGWLLVDGSSLFLAGRLNDPVGYRNATALLFCLGFWPLVGVMAARGPWRGFRALAFSMAVLEIGLAFLTQSRGMVFGLALGGVVAVGLGPDRVRRSWVAVLAFGLVAVAAGTLLTPYTAFDSGKGIVKANDVDVAVQGLAVLTVLAFAIGLAIAVFDAGLRPVGLRHWHTAARWALAGLVVVGLAGSLAAVGDPISTVQSKWNQFTDVNSAATGATRLTFAGGQRSDLWRVSLREFSRDPVAGVGAGGYPFDYYRERRSDRNLDDPHGLFFQIAGELGVVGLLLFAMFLVGVAASLRSGWRAADDSTRRTASGLAAAGGVLLGQLSVDWMWLIPGVTGIGLFCMAVSASLIVRSTQPVPMPAPRPRLALRLVVAGGLVAAAATVTVVYLSTFWVHEARAQQGLSAARQLSAARHAAELDPYSVTPLYLEAGALESMGKRVAARKALQDALDLEPENFATLGLIGDLEARAGRRGEAERYYRLALALNPLDVGLRRLAAGGGEG